MTPEQQHALIGTYFATAPPDVMEAWNEYVDGVEANVAAIMESTAAVFDASMKMADLANAAVSRANEWRRVAFLALVAWGVMALAWLVSALP